MSIKVLKIGRLDNVAIACQSLKQGEEVIIQPIEEFIGFNKDLKILENIPTAHKVSLTRILIGEYIIKYDNIIGKSTKLIEKGTLVHIHNIESIRGKVLKGVK